MICTECGTEIEKGTQYLAARWEGRRLEQRLVFFWACDHNPGIDAEVRLASRDCVQAFCATHPDYADQIVALMSAYEGHQHEQHNKYVH